VIGAWIAVIIVAILVAWLVPTGSPLALAIVVACTAVGTISSRRRRRARQHAHD
jgi:hypothetical protein